MSQFATRINDNTLRISANMLKPGMFVCRLDRPWLGTPFLMQGFLVSTNQEVAQIRDLCQQVYVDTSKSYVSVTAPDKSPRKRLFSSSPKQVDFRVNPSMERELARTGIRQALPAYSATIKSLRQCYSYCKQDDFIDARKLSKQVDNILDAVMQNTTAMAWLSRVKSHHHYTSEHSMHVSLLAMVFAIHCGWSKEQARNAGLAGLLFDIGKTRVPKQILDKPGPLTESEWELIHNHPKWARYFLEKSGFDKDVVDAAYYHHERPDGAGYPVKRLGNQAPNLARLLHILDAYDAMISYRPYAQQRTVFDATKVLYRGRDTEFDRQLVDQFIEMIGVFPVGTIVELSSGEVGVIIGQNNDSRLLPKVSIIRDRNKNPVPEVTANLRDICDASGNPRVRIKAMLHDGAYGIYMQEFTRQLLVS